MPVVIPLVVFMLAPAPAAAQLGLIEGLFRTVSDLTIYSMLGDFEPEWTSPDSRNVHGGGGTGFGLELLFTAGRITRRAAVGVARDTIVYTPVEAVVRHQGGFVTDSTTTYRIEMRRIPAPQVTLAEFELAVGYSEAGFHVSAAHAGDDAATAWEVRGALRQLPAITFYSTFNTERSVSVYLGVRSGVAQLTGLRAFGPDGTVVKGNAQAFQFGLATGFVVTAPRVQNVNLFLELALTRQHFATIEWDGKISSALPRDLRFRPYTVSAGVQIDFQNR